LITLARAILDMKISKKNERFEGISDEELLSRIAMHDEPAFNELCRRFVRWAYRFDMSILQDGQAAEDAVQEKFLRIWRKAGAFVPQTGSKASNYLLKIDKNICLDMLSLSSQRHEKLLSIPQGAEDESLEELLDYLEFRHCHSQDANSGPYEQFESSERLDSILQFTRDHFSSRQYLSFWGFVSGMTYKEIAKAYDFEPGAVRGYIARGLKRVREAFEEEAEPV
jgi:RNA polymerase sigma factor (sigma-70 family)